VRTIGIILVILGSLALAYETFRAERDKTTPVVVAERTVWIPPVVGGITLVSGLLLTAVAYRQKEE